MIYTSYFDKVSELPSDVIPISIAGRAPEEYTGIQYRKLAPKLSFYTKWKQNKDNKYYTDNYYKLVLNNLTVDKVLDDIYNKLDDKYKNLLYTTDSTIDDCKCLHIAFICYEKPGEFCHRHLIADWFKQNNIEVKEWNFGGKHNGS